MKLPLGHPLSHSPNLVCKLHKSIYGLKQSPRAWHAKLSVTLQTLGFSRSNADSSLFIQQNSAHKLIVLVYVDDLIIMRSNETSVSKLKVDLQRQFSIKDLGKLEYFLGIEMASSSKGVFLNQQKYILDMLQDIEMLHTKPVITSLDSKLWLDLSHVCGIAGKKSTLKIYIIRYLSSKYGETRNSCLLYVEKWNGSRHLVFWSLGTLTGLRDRVRGLVA